MQAFQEVLLEFYSSSFNVKEGKGTILYQSQMRLFLSSSQFNTLVSAFNQYI